MTWGNDSNPSTNAGSSSSSVVYCDETTDFTKPRKMTKTESRFLPVSFSSFFFELLFFFSEIGERLTFQLFLGLYYFSNRLRYLVLHAQFLLRKTIMLEVVQCLLQHILVHTFFFAFFSLGLS